MNQLIAFPAAATEPITTSARAGERPRRRDSEDSSFDDAFAAAMSVPADAPRETPHDAPPPGDDDGIDPRDANEPAATVAITTPPLPVATAPSATTPLILAGAADAAGSPVTAAGAVEGAGAAEPSAATLPQMPTAAAAPVGLALDVEPTTGEPPVVAAPGADPPGPVSVLAETIPVEPDGSELPGTAPAEPAAAEPPTTTLDGPGSVGDESLTPATLRIDHRGSSDASAGDDQPGGETSGGEPVAVAATDAPVDGGTVVADTPRPADVADAPATATPAHAPAGGRRADDQGALDRAVPSVVRGGAPDPDTTTPLRPLGTHRLSLDLGAEGLGPLRVEALADGGTLHLNLTAGDRATRDALGARLSELRSDLEASGVQLGSLDVSDGGRRQPGDRADAFDAERRVADRSTERAASGTAVRPVTEPTTSRTRSGSLDLRL